MEIFNTLGSFTLNVYEVKLYYHFQLQIPIHKPIQIGRADNTQVHICLVFDNLFFHI